MYNTESFFIFPNHVLVSDDDNFFMYEQELINYCYEQKKKNPSGTIKSNRGGWQSDDEVFENDLNGSILLGHIKNNIEYCLQNDLSITNIFNLQYGNFWININFKKNYNFPHNHANSALSGVFYVKIPQRSGRLVFLKNHNETNDLFFRKEDFKEKNNLNPYFFVDPKPGRLVLFPSYLLHYVEENESNDDRISLAFNLQIR